MFWFIDESVIRAIAHGRASSLQISADRLAEYETRFEPNAEGMPRNLKVAGDTAEIRVEGVLTKKPDFWSWLFGGGNTTYEQIQSALAICAADPLIKRVRFFVDSPGGHADGLFDTLAAIDAFQKPKSVTAAYACSAAYAIASVAGRIEATNEAALIGSIGVAVRYTAFADVENIDITSTEAPDKRPNPKTEEGRAVIRRELDALHELFVEAIAHGRGTTVERVNSEFGRGATLLANEAKRRKMIDRIAKPALRAINPSTEPAEPDPVETSAKDGGQQTEKYVMNAIELKDKHPEVYAAVFAEGEKAGKEAGRKEGEATERDRVEAHLTMGEASGDMKTALESVKSGATMTAALTAKYMAAGMNRKAQSARQDDSNAAGAAVDGDPPAPAAPAAAKSLLDVFAADLPAKPKTAVA